jgi:maleate isomerase
MDADRARARSQGRVSEGTMTARIGLIVPSSNRMVEQEMVKALPQGVTAHVTRLRMTGPHRVALERLLARVEEATAMLLDARCEVVAFHCTATSMEGGSDGEARILSAMAGAPRAFTTAGAIDRALRRLGARRIVLVTPYTAATTAGEAAFLATAGFEMLSATGFDLGGSDRFCAAPPQFWRDRVIEASRPDADAYLVSCANISTFPVIDDLERQLGRPIVTSNQAVIWDALRHLDWRDCAGCPGRLFAATDSHDGTGRVSAPN